MKEECLVCKGPLQYLENGELMECMICHKKENSRTRCVNGHYICDECHTNGMDVILDLCRNESSKNPVEIMEKMMGQPFCHMHGPEHHVMVGCALLTAYKNAGGEIDLETALAVQSGEKCPWRRLWILGSLRRRNQRRNICIGHFRVHAFGRRTFCLVS